VFTTVNPPESFGLLAPAGTVSDTWDKAGAPASPHELTPGFAWTPSAPAVGDVGSFGSSLYRVYVFTDEECVNEVFAGSIVGSPAFAPRATGGPIALPQTTADLAKWTGPPYLFARGAEGNAFDATGEAVRPNELAAAPSSSPSKGAAASAATASVDLWDSGWPTGRYYWTVVPVTVRAHGVRDTTKPDASQPIEYDDAAVAQDACEAGDVMSFGKVSSPVVTARGGRPWVSGISASGRMVAAVERRPTVRDLPLVSWEPALGATTYEVQLSRRPYPWRTAWSGTTSGTSLVLPLGAKQVGTWWYRIRGVDPALPAGAQAMTWSRATAIRVTGDRFVVVK
jgi:hypothetical protein